jgi:hypothetical protein
MLQFPHDAVSELTDGFRLNQFVLGEHYSKGILYHANEVASVFPK